MALPHPFRVTRLRATVPKEGYSEEGGGYDSSSSFISMSDLNGTKCVATTFATDTSNNSAVSVTATVTFASGTYQIEYDIEGAGTITRSGTYSITNTNYMTYSATICLFGNPRGGKQKNRPN